MPTGAGRLMLEVSGTHVAEPKRFVFEEPRIRVGRSSRMDVTVSDEIVSSHHLTLEWSGNHLSVRDESSTNGTVLNGHRLTPGTPVPVETGDDITIEGVRLHVANLTPPTSSADNADLTLSDSAALAAFEESMFESGSDLPDRDPGSSITGETPGHNQKDTPQTRLNDAETSETRVPASTASARGRKTRNILLLATLAVVVATGLAVVAFILRGALAG